MKAFAGLVVLVILLIGFWPLAMTHGAAPRAELADLTEGPAEDMPPYIHLDLTDWR